MQPVASIRLLGQFDFRVGGEVLPPLESARAESLLAYLLLHRDVAAPRQRLAFLLWPDSTEAQARTNLRHVLYTLRRRIPDAERYLEITARTLRWRPEVPHRLDVAAFEEQLDRDVDRDSGAGRREALRAAVEIYTGDLLEGCYDEWLLDERERLRLRHLDALAELAGLCEADGALVEAISHAERVRRGDPLREEAYRQLMRLHDACGDRARALRVYHVCTSTLERELGVEPSPATRAAYEALVPTERGFPAADTRRAIGPPMVGRDAEQARLAAAWRSTLDGRAQFVLVGGESGVGKTRLVEEFRAACARRGAVTAEARCYPAEGALAYGPVVAWLRSDVLRPRLRRLDRARLTELARLLPELLVERPDLEQPEPLPEGDQRQRLFDAVSAAVRAAAGAVLLVVDDLQHGDRETCQLLHYLLRVEPEVPVLVVATARVEDLEGDHSLRGLTDSLRARERFVEIELTRLDRAETAMLAERLTGKALAESDVRQLYGETEGNPLFVVEALRAGWTIGASLSPRVQSVIAARLGQLSASARELAGAAATIGREFSTEVLAAAADADDDTLVRGLDELWRRRIVREQGGGNYGGAYDFSHDKIRQVAYLDVSPARRRQLHLRIATALQTLHAADAEPPSAQIAAHYEQSGAAEQAITWYRRGAESAQLLQANAQAVHLLERALALLRSRPDSAERDATELAVRTALLAPLFSVEGYASPDTTATQQRALALTEALGVAPAAPLLRSLALSSLTMADYAQATRFGELLLAAGELDGDDVLVVEASYVLGVASFWQSDFAAARRYFELAVRRYRPEDRRAHLVRYGQDPKVVCLSRLANTLWFLGLPEQARDARSAALAWAEEIDHPYSASLALTFGAVLALDMSDEQGVRAYTAELVAGGQGPHRIAARAFLGYVTVLDGDTTRGVAAIEDALRETRDRPAAPGIYAMLGRILLAAHVVAGDTPATLAAADQLLEMGAAARLWEPEVRRLRAELAHLPS